MIITLTSVDIMVNMLTSVVLWLSRSHGWYNGYHAHIGGIMVSTLTSVV